MSLASDYIDLPTLALLLGVEPGEARQWARTKNIAEHGRGSHFYSERLVLLELAIEAGGPDSSPVDMVLARHPSLVNDAALRRARKETP